MTWDSATMYAQGLTFFTTIVNGIQTESWQNPSPCEGWQALDVLGHVGQATEMGTRILTGADMTFQRAEPPRSIVGDDPKTWWDDLAASARDALAGAPDLDAVVDSPMGKRTVREGLSFPGVDLFVHGWDLGTATGQSVEIPSEAIAFIEMMFTNIPDDVSRRPGVFGSRIEVLAGASPTDTIIAFCGRDPHWKA